MIVTVTARDVIVIRTARDCDNLVIRWSELDLIGPILSVTYILVANFNRIRRYFIIIILATLCNVDP